MNEKPGATGSKYPRYADYFVCSCGKHYTLATDYWDEVKMTSNLAIATWVVIWWLSPDNFGQFKKAEHAEFSRLVEAQVFMEEYRQRVEYKNMIVLDLGRHPELCKFWNIPQFDPPLSEEEVRLNPHLFDENGIQKPLFLGE